MSSKYMEIYNDDYLISNNIDGKTSMNEKYVTMYGGKNEMILNSLIENERKIE